MNPLCNIRRQTFLSFRSHSFWTVTYICMVPSLLSPTNRFPNARLDSHKHTRTTSPDTSFWLMALTKLIPTLISTGRVIFPLKYPCTDENMIGYLIYCLNSSLHGDSASSPHCSSGTCSGHFRFPHLSLHPGRRIIPRCCTMPWLRWPWRSQTIFEFVISTRGYILRERRRAIWRLNARVLISV